MWHFQISVSKNVVSYEISWTFFSMETIDNEATLETVDLPLYKPMIIKLLDAIWHHEDTMSLGSAKQKVRVRPVPKYEFEVSQNAQYPSMKCAGRRLFTSEVC